MKLTDLKGVGPKTEQLFQNIGIFTVQDLVRYYPVHYDEYTDPVAIAALAAGQKAVIYGTVTGRTAFRQFGGRSIVTTTVSDATGSLKVNWFNAPFLRSMLSAGSVFVFCGMVSEKNGRKSMEHPQILSVTEYEEKKKRLIPVYSLTKGLSGKLIGKAVQEALKIAPLTNEFLPETLLHINRLCDEAWAMRTIHAPETKEDFERARRRLAFDEFFLFIMTMRMLKAEEQDQMNPYPMKPKAAVEELLAALPYQLTGAQRRVWQEIEADLTGQRRMSRLIQGDVGSGKTIISFLAMLLCAENGYQAALMAPTEVLARQHFEKLMALKRDYHLDRLHPVLLTGSMRAAEKREALAAIAAGEANAVIGTHALIQDKVEYKSLGLVITDEQHRFGVHQRRTLSDKGRLPHSMVMSATPIPRTLAVIFYGDLAISVIDELPQSRLPIKNAIVDESWWPQAMRFIRREIAQGRQAYVICPMIEENEDFDVANVIDERSRFQKEFPDLTVGLLHGRLHPDEKNAVMERFLKNEIQILVSTTVVEVGVDVPNATVMLIENAERFGLATLHQLRGRVGRGKHQSYCIFMSAKTDQEIPERLSILKTSNNGFEIAEKDLSLRGPGDLLGIRQSGDAMFTIADIVQDHDVLVEASQTAASLLFDDPALLADEYQLLKKRLHQYRQENEKNLIL